MVIHQKLFFFFCAPSISRTISDNCTFCPVRVSPLDYSFAILLKRVFRFLDVVCAI
jgi:hypothetical protein